jgi:hypothetical protein
MLVKSLLPSLLVIGTVVMSAHERVIAQNTELVPSPDTVVDFNNIPGLFNRAANNSTGRFYDYTNILGQLNTLFGWRTFPEGSYFDNMVTRDAKLIETLYYGVMQQQQAGPLIRTQDLPNPFDTSLQENPSYLSPGGY